MEKMNNPYKTYKMKLRTLSPVFIGSGEKLSGLDYNFDFKTNKLSIVNENKFSNFLIKNNLMEKYVEYVNPNGEYVNHNAKLSKWTLLPQNADIYSKEYILNNFDRDVKELNDIHLCIKNADGMPYIPGSSIKGAIRTALLLNKILANKQTYQNKYWSEISSCLKMGNKRELGKISNNIEKDAFAMGKFKKKEIDDFMRGIIVSDSSPLSLNDLSMYKKTDYTLKDNNVHHIPLYRECINSYTDLTFSITIDTNMYSGDIKSILDAMTKYADFWNKITSVFKINNDKASIYFLSDVPEDEQEWEKRGLNEKKCIYFPNEVPENEAAPNICLGGGSGFLTKTIVYAIAPDNNATVELRQYFDKVFTSWNKTTRKKEPAHKHQQRDTVISPRTLKLVDDEGELVNIGWCNIDKEREIDVSDITN